MNQMKQLWTVTVSCLVIALAPIIFQVDATATITVDEEYQQCQDMHLNDLFSSGYIDELADKCMLLGKEYVTKEVPDNLLTYLQNDSSLYYGEENRNETKLN
jgi:hypothetical protein